MRVRTVVVSVTVLLISVAVLAGSTVVRVDRGAEEAVPDGAVVCDGPGRPGGDDPLLVVLEAGEAVRAHEQACGPAEPLRRVCRALWLATQLDPVVVEGRTTDPSTTRRAAGLLAWALEDGASAVDPATGGVSAEPALAGALRRLAGIDAELSEIGAGASVDARRATLLQARAHGEVLGPLSVAQQQCR